LWIDGAAGTTAGRKKGPARRNSSKTVDAGSLGVFLHPGDFNVFVAPDRNSMHVRLETVGHEKIHVRGIHRDLMRLNLKGDNVDWAPVGSMNRIISASYAILADNPEGLRD
jgi:hypothetical protein